MSTTFYDTLESDDTVRLLSNPLNNDNLSPDEFECQEDVKNKSSSYCSACASALPKKPNSHSFKFMDSQQLSSLNGDYHQCHHLVQTNSISHSSSKLILALCLCMLFMMAEMIGGYIAGSVAVVSDGAHLLTDVIGFLISLIAIATSKKSGTTNFNFGFYRIEILTTVTSILLIWIMTAVFIYIAVIRLIEGDYTIDVNTMIIISSIGVIINILMFSVLHGDWHTAHCRIQNQSAQEKLKASKDHQNINVQAAIVHVIGDLVQSIGVFISSIIIKFYPEAKFMDPVCTFLFSIVVICSTLKLLKNAVCILMEGFPSSMDYNHILLSLQNLNGVCHVHNLCVWSLTVEKTILIVHLAVDDTVDRNKILFQAQQIVSTKFGIHHHAIQIEKYEPKCIHACQSCRQLWS